MSVRKTTRITRDTEGANGLPHIPQNEPAPVRQRDFFTVEEYRRAKKLRDMKWNMWYYTHIVPTKSAVRKWVDHYQRETGNWPIF